MLSRAIDVRIGLSGTPVGELIFNYSVTKTSTAFRYYTSWLEHPQRFALSPNMPLQEHAFFVAAAGKSTRGVLPDPISDGTPDSWGRAIIRDALWDKMRSEGRIVNELDYLLETDDFLRSGALRFYTSRDEGATALAPSSEHSVPKYVDADDLFATARAFEANPGEFKGNRARLMGLKDNVGSLGGARPKVNVRDNDGSLLIAKLPKIDDSYGVARVEVLTLNLATKVGINASEAKILQMGDRYPISLIKRFDRGGDGNLARRSFISAQTFMGLPGTEPGNYVDLAMQIRNFGSNPKADQAELHRRLTFGVLVSNFDDHLRNHGFLSSRGKWELSPAFDINPAPEEGQSLKTAISDIHGFAPSIEAVIEVAPYFDLTEDEAVDQAKTMAETISETWRQEGKSLGMTSNDFKMIAPAFETEQMEIARKLKSGPQC